METFSLSHEDAQDRDYWRLKIKWEPANDDLPGRWSLKRSVCVLLVDRTEHTSIPHTARALRMFSGTILLLLLTCNGVLVILVIVFTFQFVVYVFLCFF